MKKLWIAALLILMASNAFSQDIIVKNDGTEIRADVKEITVDDVIKYKNYDHLQGPVRNIRTQKVFMIIYENGKREIFKKKGKASKEKSADQETSQLPDLPPPSDSSEEDTTSTETTSDEGTKEMPDLPPPSEPVEDDTSDSETTSNKGTDEPESETSTNAVEKKPTNNIEKKDQPRRTVNDKSSRSYFALAFGRGTTYGLYGAYMGYRAGAVELHVGAGGFGIVTNEFTYSAGIKIYPDHNTLFFDLQYFKSNILNDFDINLSGLSLQAGGYLPVGNVVALTASAGGAMFFQLEGTIFTYNAGLKFRF